MKKIKHITIILLVTLTALLALAGLSACCPCPSFTTDFIGGPPPCACHNIDCCPSLNWDCVCFFASDNSTTYPVC